MFRIHSTRWSGGFLDLILTNVSKGPTTRWFYRLFLSHRPVVTSDFTLHTKQSCGGTQDSRARTQTQTNGHDSGTWRTFFDGLMIDLCVRTRGIVFKNGYAYFHTNSQCQ